MAEARENPPFHHLHAHLDFSFIPRTGGTGGDDRHAIVLREFGVGAGEGRLIAMEPTKASWYISVTTDSNCICTVTAILPPTPLQTYHCIRGGEDSGKGWRGQAASKTYQE